MRFVRLLSLCPDAPDKPDRSTRTALAAELRAGRSIGNAVLGENHFFIRKFRTAYYLPYEDIARCFRRVMAVPVKLGCCAGDLRVEYVIIRGYKPDNGPDYHDSGDENGADENGGGMEWEVARIQMPGERAAKALMEELRARCPDSAFGVPAKAEEAERTASTQAKEAAS